MYAGSAQFITAGSLHKSYAKKAGLPDARRATSSKNRSTARRTPGWSKQYPGAACDRIAVPPCETNCPSGNFRPTHSGAEST